MDISGLRFLSAIAGNIPAMGRGYDRNDKRGVKKTAVLSHTDPGGQDAMIHTSRLR
jgi:hypothetical protein